MAEKKQKRRARGEGAIRQREDGRWESRITIGRNPGTGKQIRKSIYGKSEKEVLQKKTAAIAALNKGDYKEPCKMTLAQWLDIWQREYLGGVKPSTAALYSSQIRVHIKPAMGATKLEALNPHTIQGFYNGLGRGQDGNPGLSAKSIKNVHGILHKALEQAVKIGYIRVNPADACTLPRVVRKEIKPLDEDTTALFVEAIKGHQFECLYLVTLFTGLRQGEVMGLSWDCVDFAKGTLNINKQLQKAPGGGSIYNLTSPKNGKGRTITPAPYVMDLLKEQRRKQAEWQIKAGPAWENEWNLVFTNELGTHMMTRTVYNNFKAVVASIGQPNVRFHDLRHSYAVAAIRAGDDVKTVQGNLGHHTAAFTLDQYGHVTEQMKRDSADRMQKYIDSLKTG